MGDVVYLRGARDATPAAYARWIETAELPTVDPVLARILAMARAEILAAWSGRA